MPNKNLAKLKIGPQDEKKTELLNTVEQIDLCSKTLKLNVNCLCNISINKDEKSNIYEEIKSNIDEKKNKYFIYYNSYNICWIIIVYCYIFY